MQKNRINELRTRKGLSKTQLSELIGLSVYSITTWERGHHIPSKYYGVLSKAFNLPVEEIVWEESTDHREINYISDPRHFDPAPDVRPQIECFCGNCDYWKEGSELLLKCACKSADKYGLITGRNYLCTHWFSKGLSYSDVLTVLPEDGVLWKNIMDARILKGITVEQVSKYLRIDKALWMQYEKGIKAMPLQQLALFSELCGISGDKLVKEN